jgi:hypothetical protein
VTPPPPSAAAAPAVRPRSVPRRPPRAPAPRRVSGPAKRKVSAGPPAARAYTPARGGAVALPAPGGLAAGLLEALAGISSSRWLDRLIRGRAWIGLLAFALIGIVAMQLWVVKLGVGIGRALEHEGLLQRENAALSIEDAKLSSGERVEQLAAARGMVVAPPGALHFETARGALDARLAAAALAHSGQVQSTSTGFAGSSEGAASASGAAAEPSPSSGESATAGASTETTAASATGSTESSSTTAEGSSGAAEGSAASSESSTPVSGTAAETPSTSASESSSASTPSSTGTGGATPTAESETTSVGGGVSAGGGTQQPAAGG